MRKWRPGLHENRRTLPSAGFRSSSLAVTEHAPAAWACAVRAAEVFALSWPGRAGSSGGASLPRLGRAAGRGARRGASVGSSARGDPPCGEGGGSRFFCPDAPLRERSCVGEGEGSPRRSSAHGAAREERPRPLGAVGAGPLRGLLGPSAVSAAPPGAATDPPDRNLLRGETFPRLVSALPSAGSPSLLLVENVRRGRAGPGHPRAARPLRGPSPDREPCPHRSGPSATQSFIRKQPVDYIADH